MTKWQQTHRNIAVEPANSDTQADQEALTRSTRSTRSTRRRISTRLHRFVKAICCLTAMILAVLGTSLPAYTKSVAPLTKDINDFSKPWFPEPRSAPVPGEKVRTYTMLLGGVTVGSLTSYLRIDSEDSYNTEIDIVPASLIRAFTTFRINLVSRGQVTDNGLQPIRTEVRVISGEDRKWSEFHYTDGKLSSSTVRPAPVPEEQRFPIPDNIYETSADMTTAFLVKRDSRFEPYDIRQCNRTIPIFNGWVRSEIILGGYRVKTYDRPKDDTKVIECHGRWRTIGGHKPGPVLEEKLTSKFPIRILLTHDEKTDTLLPVRIQVNADFGIAILRHDFE